MDTVLLACRLYKKDADKFKELCSKQNKFHAEVLRMLILNYNRYVEKGWKFENVEKGWEKGETKGEDVRIVFK